MQIASRRDRRLLLRDQRRVKIAITDGESLRRVDVGYCGDERKPIAGRWAACCMYYTNMLQIGIPADIFIALIG